MSIDDIFNLAVATELLRELDPAITEQKIQELFYQCDCSPLGYSRALQAAKHTGDARWKINIS